MGASVSRSCASVGETVSNEVVVGSIVETVDVCEELFRSNDIVVMRVNKHFILTHGKRQATFSNVSALVESFLAEACRCLARRRHKQLR